MFRARSSLWAPVFLVYLIAVDHISGHLIQHNDDLSASIERLSDIAEILDSGSEWTVPGSQRIKRQSDQDDVNKGVTNLDIRDAILQLLNVVREGNKRVERHEVRGREISQEIVDKLSALAVSGGTDKKIDNISTFLLRMNAKLESVERHFRRSRGGDVLQTLAQESFDILTLLPTYIENTKDAVAELASQNKAKFSELEGMLSGEVSDENGEKKSLASVLKSTETTLLTASNELKAIVIESGHMAESLFETVNDGYNELTDEIKGLSNVEQVLLDTADSVMDTKRKLEFGVQQIIFKVGELVKVSGGHIDDQLKDQFQDITRTILSNQTEALGNLTKKVEKEIGQVWRQMGIMYSQVSNSIKILEKVKDHTEGYVNRTGSNLGTMEGQVEGLTDRMVDVDSNLNYMLGQLSLVVQEFNQVKTGLGEAMSGLGEELEEIKEFKPKQDQEN